MGFFGSMFASAGKAMVDGMRDMKQFREEYSGYSDSRLVSIARGEGIFGSRFTEKAAALAVLSERYGGETAREMIRRG